MHTPALGDSAAHIVDKLGSRARLADTHHMGLFLQSRLSAHPHDVVDGQLVAEDNLTVLVDVDYSRKTGKRQTEIIQER